MPQGPGLGAEPVSQPVSSLLYRRLFRVVARDLGNVVNPGNIVAGISATEVHRRLSWRHHRRDDPRERAILARGELPPARACRVEWLDLRGHDLSLLPLHRGCLAHALDRVTHGTRGGPRPSPRARSAKVAADLRVRRGDRLLAHSRLASSLSLASQAHLQLTGVLQKIAVCYLVAFLIYLWTGLRGVIVGIIGLNLLYLGLLYFYPVPGCGPGSLAVSCNFPGYLDEIVLDGFRWNSTAFDPDGVGSILPAITSVLFGVLAGHAPAERATSAAAAPAASGRANCSDRCRRIALDVGADQQAALDHLLRRLHGGAGGNRPGLLSLARRRPPVATLASDRWRFFGLNAIAAYLISRLVANVPRVHVMGKSLYADVLRAFGEPAECVPAVRDGGAGCRLLGGLAHGSPGLVSKILVRQPAKRTFDEPAYRTGFMSTRTRAQAVAQTAAAHCRRRSSASARRGKSSASI